MLAWSRNPNYLGEMMVYCSWALLLQSRAYWAILLSKWVLVFSLRIIKKEYSLSLKPGYSKYCSHSWILLPKVGGSLAGAVLFYGLLAALAYPLHLRGLQGSLSQLV